MPVAIVTGASSGLGLHLSQALARRGYGLVAVSRRLAPDHPVVEQIGAESIRVVGGDVADPSVAERAMGAAAELGGLDLLVNNAGVFIPKAFTEYDADDFDTLLGTNVRSFFNFTRLALRAMLERGSGHVVTITTSLAENPIKAVPSVLPILTKGGLNAATRALALEVAERGVRVNAVSPGIMKTPMHDGADESFLDELHPMGRMGEAEDVTRGVLYLEESPFATGEILHVDGGAAVGRW